MAKIDFCVKSFQDVIIGIVPDKFNVSLIDENDISDCMTNYIFEAKGEKRAIVTLYENTDGSKNLVAAGQAKELAQDIIKFLIEEKGVITTAVMAGNKTIKKFPSERLADFLAELTDMGCSVENQEDSDVKKRYRVSKRKQGHISITFFSTNSTLQMQGASNLYFSEVVARAMKTCGHEFESMLEIIGKDAHNAGIIKWEKNALRTTLDTKIGAGQIAQLWSHDIERLKTLQVFLDNDFELPEYSLFIAQAGFVIEGALKKFLIKIGYKDENEVSRNGFRWIYPGIDPASTFKITNPGNILDLNFSLPNQYANYTQVMLDAYEFLRTYRHDFCHSRKNIQLVTSRADATYTIGEAYKIIQALLT